MMKYGLAKSSNHDITFLDGMHEELNEFCQQRRSFLDSKCKQHYQFLFSNREPSDTIKIVTCPYGLNTSTPFGSASMPRAIYGFYVSDSGKEIPPELPASLCISPDETNSLLALVGGISKDIREEETSHFEAALHDARHLNHSITQHAEMILSRLGYPPDADWDMTTIQQDEMARRTLSVYAASRDLSDAISMHEISQDVSRIQSNKIPTPIHKLFYRQIKISAERLSKTGLLYSLGSTQKSINLTPEFRLIPKILIDNAIKYSSRNAEISIKFIESPNFFKIICSNVGAIIRQDEYGSVFTRGGRGSNKSGIQGRGLGLWLAKAIVEANLGTIEITTQEESRDYSGRKTGTTTVTIRLP